MHEEKYNEVHVGRKCSMCFHLSMAAVLASDTFHSVTAETSGSLAASRANKLTETWNMQRYHVFHLSHYFFSGSQFQPFTLEIKQYLFSRHILQFVRIGWKMQQWRHLMQQLDMQLFYQKPFLLHNGDSPCITSYWTLNPSSTFKRTLNVRAVHLLWPNVSGCEIRPMCSSETIVYSCLPPTTTFTPVLCTNMTKGRNCCLCLTNMMLL